MNDKKILYSYFTDDDFVQIAEIIRESEIFYRGEIHVAIRVKRPWYRFWKDGIFSAKNEFAKQAVEDSQDKAGLLLYILLKEREVHLLTTEKLREIIPAETMSRIVDDLRDDFKLGRYSKGILLAVRRLSDLMIKYSPPDPPKNAPEPEKQVEKVRLVGPWNIPEIPDSLLDPLREWDF